MPQTIPITIEAHFYDGRRGRRQLLCRPHEAAAEVARIRRQRAVATAWVVLPATRRPQPIRQAFVPYYPTREMEVTR